MLSVVCRRVAARQGGALGEFVDGAGERAVVEHVDLAADKEMLWDKNMRLICL